MAYRTKRLVGALQWFPGMRHASVYVNEHGDKAFIYRTAAGYVAKQIQPGYWIVHQSGVEPLVMSDADFRAEYEDIGG